jgi:hypothetical protein
LRDERLDLVANHDRFDAHPGRHRERTRLAEELD